MISLSLSCDLITRSHDLNCLWTCSEDQLAVNTAPAERPGKCSCLSIWLAHFWWRLFLLFLSSLAFHIPFTTPYLWPLRTSPHKPVYLSLICAVNLNLILSFRLTQTTHTVFIFHFSCGPNTHHRLLGNHLSIFFLPGADVWLPICMVCVHVCGGQCVWVCVCVSPERGLAKLSSGAAPVSSPVIIMSPSPCLTEHTGSGSAVLWPLLLSLCVSLLMHV